MSRINSFSFSDKSFHISFSRNSSIEKSKYNSAIYSSASKEIGAFGVFESNASIEIRPALYKRTFEDLTRTTKTTKNSTNSPTNEINHSVWHKFQTGTHFMKGSI